MESCSLLSGYGSCHVDGAQRRLLFFVILLLPGSLQAAIFVSSILTKQLSTSHLQMSL